MLVLAACAPLQQAPLVYTSGVTVGLKVGVSPTQADAFETVIGFKMLDAAYVPVAVSKPDANGEVKTSDTHSGKVHEIYGQFGEEITPEAVRQLNAGEMEAVKSYLGALKNTTDGQRGQDDATRSHNIAVEAGEAAKKRVDEARSAIVGLRSVGMSGCNFATPELGLGASGAVDWLKVDQNKVNDAVKACNPLPAANASVADTEGVTNARKLLEKGAQALERYAALSDALNAAQTKEGETKQLLVEAKYKLNIAQADLDAKEKSAMEALQKLANIRKRDALSVYGSFNGSLDQSVANKGPTIGSKLGKVFSTGVAAQNLTEAAKISATSEAFSQCVANLKDLAGVLAEDKREGFIKQAIENCGNGVKNTTADKKNA
jgi:hypothetical protein